MTFPRMFVFAFLVAPGMAFSCFLAVFSSIWDRFGCPLRVFFGFLGALFLFSFLGGCPVIAFSSLNANLASKRVRWGAFWKTCWCPGGEVKIAFSSWFQHVLEGRWGANSLDFSTHSFYVLLCSTREFQKPYVFLTIVYRFCATLW